MEPSFSADQLSSLNPDLFISKEEKNGKVIPKFNYTKITDEIIKISQEAISPDGTLNSNFKIKDTLLFSLLKAKDLIHSDVKEDLERIIGRINFLYNKEYQKYKLDPDYPTDPSFGSLAKGSILELNKSLHSIQKRQMLFLAFVIAKELGNDDFVETIKRDFKDDFDFEEELPLEDRLHYLMEWSKERDVKDKGYADELINAYSISFIAKGILLELQKPDLKDLTILEENKHLGRIIKENVDEIADCFLSDLKKLSLEDDGKQTIKNGFAELLPNFP